MSKRIVFIAIVVLIAPAVAHATSIGTVTLKAATEIQVPYYQYFHNGTSAGGPFWAVTQGNGALPDGSFLTFCLEMIETINLNTPYTYSTSDYAKAGGNGAIGPEGDPLSDATKWLYYTARFGDYVNVMTAALVASGYTTTSQIDGQLPYTGKYFQQAIWDLEEERVASDVAKKLVDLANARVAAGDWDAIEAEGHRVVAINVDKTKWDKTTKSWVTIRGQDQLGYYSVPDSGSTLVLVATMAPVGVVAYFAGIIRRRRRTQPPSPSERPVISAQSERAAL